MRKFGRYSATAPEPYPTSARRYMSAGDSKQEGFRLDVPRVSSQEEPRSSRRKKQGRNNQPLPSNKGTGTNSGPQAGLLPSPLSIPIDGGTGSNTITPSPYRGDDVESTPGTNHRSLPPIINVTAYEPPPTEVRRKRASSVTSLPRRSMTTRPVSNRKEGPPLFFVALQPYPLPPCLLCPLLCVCCRVQKPVDHTKTSA